MLDVIDQLRLYGEAAEAAVAEVAEGPPSSGRAPRRRRGRVLAAAAATILVAGLATGAVVLTDRDDSSPDVALPGLAPGEAGGARDAWAHLRLDGESALTELEGFEHLLDMRDAADLVVVGNFTRFEPGRTQVEVLEDEGPNGEDVEEQLGWIDGHFAVDEVIAHADNVDLDEMLDGDAVTVELEFGSRYATNPSLEEIVDGLNGTFAGTADRAVLFLRLTGGPNEPVADPCAEWPISELEALGLTRENCDVDAIREAIGEPAPPPVDEATGAGRLRFVNSYGLITATDGKPVDVPLSDFPTSMPRGPAVPGEPPPFDARDAWANLDELIADLR